MAALTYKEARNDIMTGLQLLYKMIPYTGVREGQVLMETYDALHRELAKIDSERLAQSNEKYAALTLRFKSSKSALETAKKKADELADRLNFTAQAIDSISNLIGVL